MKENSLETSFLTKGLQTWERRIIIFLLKEEYHSGVNLSNLKEAT